MAPAAEACRLCQVEHSPVWRRDRITKERVCNKCYRKRHFTEDGLPPAPKAPPSAEAAGQPHFRAAGPEDFKELEALLDKYKDFLMRTMKCVDPDVSATDYQRSFRTHFQKYQKALACMATKEYFEWAGNLKIGDRKTRTFLNHWKSFWEGELGRSGEPPAASGALAAGRPGEGEETVKVKMEPAGNRGAEPAVNGVKEDVKDEKSDIKEDEVKLEELLAVKEEQGSGTNGSVEAKKRKRHRSEGATPEPAAADLETPAVETETEYADADLGTCPEKLHVHASGIHKVDGAYSRMSRASRGKPCYMKWTDKRPMYLFWNKKWIIGWDFGATKSMASAKDAPGILTPCEPFPRIWKVMEKKEKDKKDRAKGEKKEKEAKQYYRNLAMRVIDGALLDMSLEDEELAAAVPDERAHASSGKRASRRRIRRAASETGEATEPGAEKAAAAKKQDEVGPADESDDEDGSGSEASEEAQPNRDAQKASDSSEDGSVSSSEESSSSESASKPEAKVIPPRPTAWQITERKAAEFESKLRDQLSKLMDPHAKYRKFQVVRDMLTQKANGAEIVPGLPPERVQGILDKLDKDLSSAAQAVPVPAAKPKPPQGPPPKWMLPGQKAQPQPQAPGLAAAPMTPPMEDIDLARLPPPTRTVLRKPGGPRRSRRITYTQGEMFAREVYVESYRSCGEQLWFHMPGAIVACDGCDKAVPQSMGSLQGAPAQSQFAQNRFICGECMGFMG
mmetsp:Transcript_19130/g.55546  ORF Transcript_19130/g.55546 Transcript_19130/m.55546 type:complete len:734 (+) Transcript_19130:117-2318(+)